jgi:hypothetical protein
MFRPDRDRLLSQVVWNGDRGGHADKKDLSYYVDCCKYAGVGRFGTTRTGVQAGLVMTPEMAERRAWVMRELPSGSDRR